MNKGFFLAIGNVISLDIKNMKFIETHVIPNKGDFITLLPDVTSGFKGGTYQVVDKRISYTQVENYNINDLDRGTETIFCFVEHIETA